VTVSGRGVQARLHSGSGGDYLWVVNPGREATSVRVALDSARLAPIRSVADVWQTGVPPAKANGLTLDIVVGDRDVAVLKLQH
jgi:hypothetical protein